jgi:hypothetical protein
LAAKTSLVGSPPLSFAEVYLTAQVFLATKCPLPPDPDAEDLGLARTSMGTAADPDPWANSSANWTAECPEALQERSE